MNLRVLTINIWNEQGPWEARKVLLTRAIAALKPDIVGMQEVIGRGDVCQAHDLTLPLGHHVAFGAARALGNEGEYGNAITSRFDVLDRRVLELPCLGMDEPRSMLLVELDTPSGRLPVLVTHFSWRMDHGAVREAQALAVADALDGIRGDVLPPIVMGDLNAAPDTPEIRFLTGSHELAGRNLRLCDCHAAVGSGDGFTFDGRYNSFAEPWKEPPRRIDYILIDGPDDRRRGTPVTSEVVFTEALDGVTPSDHYGVVATIRY